MEIKAYATLDMTGWQKAAQRFVDELGYSVAAILREEVRELLKLAIDFTPPHSKPNAYMKKKGRSRITSRNVGLQAIERDILRTMRPLRPDDFESKEMKLILSTRDTARYARFVAHLPSSSPLAKTQVVEFASSQHTSRRDRRGHVRRDYKNVVLGDAQSDKLEEYIERVQGRVGWSKAGWLAPYTLVGGTAPAFVKRHNWRASYGEDNLKDKKEPSITLINKTDWGAREGRRILRAAVGIREKKMASKLRYGLKQVAKANGLA